MAGVKPLRGIRYNSVAAGNLAPLVTPPYDVISEEAQARYYAHSPYNIIRLELGLDEPDDTTLNNRYTRAASTFAEWRVNSRASRYHKNWLVRILPRGYEPTSFLFPYSITVIAGRARTLASTRNSPTGCSGASCGCQV